MVKQTHLCKNNFNQQKNNKKKEKNQITEKKEKNQFKSCGSLKFISMSSPCVGNLDMALIFDH